jgi:hypothetical protein
MALELVTLVVVLAILGFAVWLVLTYIPMPEPFKKAIVVIVVLVLLVWVARWLLGGGALLPLR